jgi:hypothetical protein
VQPVPLAQLAPRLCPDVVSQVIPHAPQLEVVSSASQKPEQHEAPAEHGCAVSQPTVQLLLGLQI